MQLPPWGPAADGHDRPFWDGLADHELRLQRCNVCQAWIWGPQAICHSCHNFDIGWQTVEPIGTVYSWCRSWYPYIEELADKLPYVSVLVELDHADGRRILGMSADDPADTPRIGQRVVGSFEHHDGAPWPLLRWRSAETGATP